MEKIRIICMAAAVLFAASCVKTGPKQPDQENTGGQEQKEEQKDPQIPQVDVSLDVRDGLVDFSGVKTNAGASVKVSGKVSSVFQLDLSIDGKPSSSTSTFVKEIKPGIQKNIEFPEGLAFGRHSYKGVLSVQYGEDQVEPVNLSGEFWMASSPVENVAVKIETKLKSIEPSEGETVTLNSGVTGTISLNYKPESSLAVINLSVSKPESVKLDMSKMKTEKGFVSVPFEVKKEDVVDFECTLQTSARETTKFSCKLDSTSGPLKTVQEVTVPQDVTVTLGQPGSFTVGVYPEDATDAMVNSAVSSSADLVVKSYDGLTVNLEGRWPGDYSVEVEVGEAKIRKTVPVKVVGSVVTGFQPSVSLDGTEIGYGKGMDIFIYPVPADAFDASTVKVESLSPGVVAVVSNGNHSYTLSGLDFGEADVIVSTRGASASYHVKVPETLSLDKDAYECAYGNSAIIQVSGDYKAVSVAANGKDVSGYFDFGFCKVTREGSRITVENTNRTLETKKLALVLKTSVFGVTKNVEVIVKGMSNTVNISGFNVGRGADGKIRFDFSITNEKMQPYTVNSFYGYLVNDSMDQMDIVARCEEIMRSGTYMDDIVEKEGEFSEPRIIARSFNVKFDVIGFPESVAPGETVGFSWTPSKTGDSYGEYNGETILVGRIDGSTGVIIWDY